MCEEREARVTCEMGYMRVTYVNQRVCDGFYCLCTSNGIICRPESSLRFRARVERGGGGIPDGLYPGVPRMDQG